MKDLDNLVFIVVLALIAAIFWGIYKGVSGWSGPQWPDFSKVTEAVSNLIPNAPQGPYSNVFKEDWSPNKSVGGGWGGGGGDAF